MKKLLCGLDEAGRGPLAGPVTAGAVILKDDFYSDVLNDSKQLSEKKRNLLIPEIVKGSLCYGIGIVWEYEIDEINILKASLLAMERAFENMKKQFCLDDFEIEAIADGIYCPEIDVAGCKAVVKADAKYPCVMAASVLAKVARDRIMYKMDAFYPEYGYAKHKGYPTKAHREKCHEIGISPIQRLSFNY